MEVYKDCPETLKKATYVSRRVKNKLGKWVMEQRTKVYERAEGEYKFLEVMGKRLENKSMLDDGQLQVVEGQQQQVMDDAEKMAFEGRGFGLLQHELESPPNTVIGLPSNTDPQMAASFKEFMKDRLEGSSSASGRKDKSSEGKERRTSPRRRNRSTMDPHPRRTA